MSLTGFLRRWGVPLILLAAATQLTLGCRDRPTAGGNSTGPGWVRLPAPGDLPADRKLRAGFLIVDGVYNSELVAPYDILHHTVFHTEPGIEVFTVSPDGGTVKTFEGLRLTPDYGFANAPEIDILVVPSAEGSMDRDLENEEMMRWVRETGSRARFVVSLCDGAFVLAAAGLLDGRECTTFPGDQDRFAETFPGLEVKRGVSFVHDGPALTSQGGARSYDVAVYLVDHLYGEEVARGVARGLVIDWPPSEGSLSAIVARPGGE
jgi:transcriptional regulator GlxA family with amidase domain